MTVKLKTNDREEFLNSEKGAELVLALSYISQGLGGLTAFLQESLPTAVHAPPAVGEETTNGRKKRKKKDPEAPKRPMSAYFLYLNDHRDEVSKQMPDAPHKNVVKEIANRWRELTDFDKQVGAGSDAEWSAGGGYPQS
ncbi:high mobility group box domain-containing protein [Blyttiomyces helicus]|uniref:High mobility group box domain-containing protein n=1 Tax=Blyttiomyces helicus TaxID=388810 RepID=A0A4P9WC96_9FUNG|nr:high mobility group box domain-containing protein [Blyttiomyces helicus]|eukprot:RKO88510.1 high mobility group box domain-containing protein [Blyttiomyces helicus]